MGIGRTNTGGGGGGLNFKIISGTVQPNNPKENTIWINTDVKIAAWAFSAEEPIGANGAVWFEIGANGEVSFNALKKNSIVLCPVYAKQHVNGVWIEREWAIFQNGAWTLFGAGMDPATVTTTGGRLQYWTSVTTDNDGWHDVTSGSVTNFIPFDNYEVYAGRNGNGVYHNAALAFKTGSFTGKGKHIKIEISVRSFMYEDGFAYVANLSKHNWSNEAEWLAGSKNYYSEILTELPSDPNAIASTSGTFAKNGSRHTETITFDAEILPNPEYVIYMIGTKGTKGYLLTIDKTASYPMTITVTE